MINPVYHFRQMRELLDEYEPSRERSLAATKLDECEMWLAKCTPTRTAVERDQCAPAPEHAGWGQAADVRHRAASARDALDAQSLHDSPGSDL